MKLLGKKRIAGRIDGKIVRSRESRFAKVVSIDYTNRRAIVRIQGTQEDIYAGWSRNFYDVPPFVKVNNPVEIQHMKGNPHRYEIIASGTELPTPVDGTSVLSTLPSAANKVITGGQVTIMPGTGTGMHVEVGFGTFRIDNLPYAIDGVYLGDTAVPVMGTEFPLMGTIGGIIELDPAPASPNYRIDIIEVGADGVLDYRTGTPSASDPVQPTVSPQHVLLAYIIVPYGTTELQQSFIGNAWTEPYLAQMSLTMGTMGQYWYTLPFPNTLNQQLTQSQRRVLGTIDLLNQYQKPLVGSFGMRVTLEPTMIGNGLLYHGNRTGGGGTGYTELLFTITDGTNNLFTYERLGVDGLLVLGAEIDESPTIKVELLGSAGFVAYQFVELYDSTIPEAKLLIGV